MTITRYCPKHRPEFVEGADRMDVGRRLLAVATGAVAGIEYCEDCKKLNPHSWYFQGSKDDDS